jgi:hypothetical protein
MKGVREKRVYRGSETTQKKYSPPKKERDKKIKKSTKESPTLEKNLT